MNAPPPELAWVGIIGGAIGIATAIINLIIIWRNRRRIEFRSISSKIYYEPWQRHEIEASYHPDSPPSKIRAPIKEGDCKLALIVVEFVVKNEFPTDVTVGRFLVDGWMFSSRYDTKGLLYPLKRDYRVFDLHTRQETNLESYNKISPKGVYGIRLEVLEKTDGPQWGSSKSRYVVKLPKNYSVEFQTDMGHHRYTIRLGKPHGMPELLKHVHHWSDLLPPAESATTTYALPLSVQYPRSNISLWRNIWWKLKAVVYRAKWWILYGKSFHLPGEPNRISRFIRRFQKK